MDGVTDLYWEEKKKNIIGRVQEAKGVGQGGEGNYIPSPKDLRVSFSMIFTLLVTLTLSLYLLSSHFLTQTNRIPRKKLHNNVTLCKDNK